ncbi:hypothetical protein BKA69DRAFT_1086659 [Paraphysoderma sedebokerense]|nr:hypothetical protein BKA69DRAFT_1086659 [Paraphysoderma sedebokerense]
MFALCVLFDLILNPIGMFSNQRTMFQCYIICSFVMTFHYTVSTILLFTWWRYLGHTIDKLHASKTVAGFMICMTITAASLILSTVIVYTIWPNWKESGVAEIRFIKKLRFLGLS